MAETQTKDRASAATDEAMREASAAGLASTDLVLSDRPAARGMLIAEQVYTEARRRAVAEFLQIGAGDPALLPYLALCMAWGYDPVAGHVWLIPQRQKVRDAQGNFVRGADGKFVYETKYRPAVGRDGLLFKAHEAKGKPGGFRGLRFGVVCERDTFEVEDDGSLDGPRILHRQASKPTEFAPGVAPDRWRGRILGAWAKCFMDGEATYYYAPLREHGKTTTKDGDTTWDGSWEYTSTMILKSAQSYVLRIALGITGFVPVDELRDVREWQGGGDGASSGGVGQTVQADVPEFEWDSIADEELRARVRHAVEVANEQEPLSWSPAKCEMVLSGRSEAELRTLVEQMESENDLREQRIARAAGEGEVVDATVVEDQPPATPPAVEEQQLTPEQAERVETLRHRLADLQAGRDEAAPNSPEEAALAAEMDQVEAEVRSITGGSAGQQGLDVG